MVLFGCNWISGLLKRIHVQDGCNMKSEFSHSLEGFEFRPVCKAHLAYPGAQNSERCWEVNDEDS